VTPLPLQMEMDALVADVNGAVGAIIVDYDGETVVASSNDFDTYDLQVVGAYGGIFLDHLRRITREHGFGAPASFVISGRQARLLHHVLRNGYFIVVILRHDACLATARRRLELAHQRIVEEF
jgi:predicted regulator of Ras-like GTPase activity (Roadblock/LC7/MglB family)